MPILAGRDALLRVFVVGNMTLNNYAPPVHVHVFHEDSLIDTLVIPATKSKISRWVTPGSVHSSWNAPIPPEHVRPGLGFRVIVDPEETVERSAESRTTFPHDGGIHRVDVRALPPHRVRFVPVHQNGSDGMGSVDTTNAASFLTAFERLFPVSNVEYDVRGVYTTDTGLWGELLQELRALRTIEESSSYYYGVVANADFWPVAGGVAFVGQPIAAGWDASWMAKDRDWRQYANTFAHEMGHNFGLLHAPCGDVKGVDPSYPYHGGTIGWTGYDMVLGLVRSAGLRDIMSYCQDEWISDYMYEAALSFREQEVQEAAAFDDAADQAVLLVWGRIEGDGDLRLEPAFDLVARPTPPSEPGPYTVQGLDRAGNTLFSRSFRGDELADGEPGTRFFTFAIPVGHLEPGSVHQLRLTGPGRAIERVTTRAAADPPPAAVRGAARAATTTITWEVSHYPTALVRDPQTGHVLAIARNGRIELPGHDGVVEVVLSHGTGSTRAHLRQP